jgi:ferredoxin
MDIQSVSCVCFSPTGSTRRITETIAKGLNPAQLKINDVTRPVQREGPDTTFHRETVIFATPVYYGRVPEEAAASFAVFKGEETYAILVVVYGNRAYEDALRELYDIATEQNFIPIAGAAFAAEHSYSTSTHPIAPGRPDEEDLMKARSFGAEVRKKLQGLPAGKGLTPIRVPGNVPYIEPVNLNRLKEARQHLPLTPETDIHLCNRCEKCAEVCPTMAISREDTSIIDRWKCLICFACIKTCPIGAKQMNEPHFNSAIQELYNVCQERKEPEWYL